MRDDFYRAFEDRHRGSRDLIKSRMRVYLSLVEPLKAIYSDCRAVDLGCGRGEWLELMRETGIDAYGVDLDDGMLAACRERGLAVEQGDAIAYLRGLPDGSVAVVSAFHVVEHIPFDALQTLVQEALRVLVPAGLLILETPNPENLSVGACKFYYDPTHHRPIPPTLLSFLPEHYGFARTKVLRLQEPPGLSGDRAVTLQEVLTSVSPDYSVVAQKCANSPDQFVLFDPAFEREYGVTLEALAGGFESRIGQLFHSQAQLSQAQAQLSQAQAQLSQAQAQLSQAQAQLAALYASTSWRVTAPMRWLTTGLRSFGPASVRARLRLKTWLKPHVVRAVTHPASKRLIERTGRWVIAHPGLADPLRSFLRRHERLRHRLRWLVLGSPREAGGGGAGYRGTWRNSSVDNLTPRARRIYQDLLDAVAARKRST